MSPPAQTFKHIAFVASQTPEARAAYAQLEARYGNAKPEDADVIVALGGDGLMLQTLHTFMKSGKPIYGMHRGTVGFLMNEFVARRSGRTAGRRAPDHHPSAGDAGDRRARPRSTNIAPSTKSRCSARARRPRICAF